MGGSRCKYNLGKLGLLDILRWVEVYFGCVEWVDIFYWWVGVDGGEWRYILVG